MRRVIQVLTPLFICGVSAIAIAQQRTYLPGEIEGGGRLYQSNCTGCHGPEGDGVSTVNFARGQFRRSQSDDEIGRAHV